MKQLKRIAIIVAGAVVLVLGVAMIVLPGPAFLMIPAGLAILAIEFEWARRWLRSLRALVPGAKRGNVAGRKVSPQSIVRTIKGLFRRAVRIAHIKRRPACP